MRPILPALLLAILGACSAPPSQSDNACAGLHGDRGITARLYFGRTNAGEAAWQTFLVERVTPRFPAGFTVLDGYGQWQQRSTGKIIREPSTIIEVAVPRTPETIWKFEEIRADYRQQFNQESVGLVVSESCASF